MALTRSKLLRSDAQASSSLIMPPSRSRRHALLTVATFLTAVPKPASALKERNEALCATGFFTNIGQFFHDNKIRIAYIAALTFNSMPSTIAGQWYCTPIGNIADEGQSGVLSPDQEGVADSLMSKLGMADETTTSTSESKTKNDSDGSTAMGDIFTDTNL